MLLVVGLAAGAAYLIFKPQIEARLAQNADFKKDAGRNNIMVMINGKPVTLILDSGSDLTLLTAEEGRRLGLGKGTCKKLPVSGISATAESFCKESVAMRVGDTEVFKSWVGVASPGNPLPDNLFGAKDMDRFHVTISKGQIRFSQAHTGCDGGVCMLPPKV
jgi:hypothetical protein